LPLRARSTSAITSVSATAALTPSSIWERSNDAPLSRAPSLVRDQGEADSNITARSVRQTVTLRAPNMMPDAGVLDYT
jgi:hypothetical protein